MIEIGGRGIDHHHVQKKVLKTVPGHPLEGTILSTFLLITKTLRNVEV